MAHITSDIQAHAVADALATWFGDSVSDQEVLDRCRSVDALLACGHCITGDDLMRVYVHVMRHTSARRTLPMPSSSLGLIQRIRRALVVAPLVC